MSGLRVGKDAVTVRKTFNEAVGEVVPVPNLIEIQSNSFNDFVQLDYLPSERVVIGLEKVLRDIFPIEYEGKMSLEYVSYELGIWTCTCGKLKGIENRYAWSCTVSKKSGCSRLSEDASAPKTARYKTCSFCLSRVTIQLPMSADECRSNGQTFSMPLKIKVQLITWEGEGKDRFACDIKEQDIFFADIPVMSDVSIKNGRFEVGNEGTFIINGVERVVVSQLHRSPGVIYSQSKKIKDVRGRPYFVSRIIPMRGSWIDFEFDSSDHLYVRVDKKKKMLVTTFLQALGVSRESIIPLFYTLDTIVFEHGIAYVRVDEKLVGYRLEKGMLPAKYENDFVGKRVNKEVMQQLLDAGIKKIVLPESTLVGRVAAQDIIDDTTGELLVSQGHVITAPLCEKLKACDKIKIQLITSTGYVFQPVMASTLVEDDCLSYQEALKEIHSKIWPGDNSSLEEIKERFENLFFNPRYYDLTRVGRIRINRKLGLTTDESNVALTKEDIIASLKYLINLREKAEGELDDIDHLGNRRVRLVGELLGNQVYLGFLRIERIVRERFRSQESYNALMPQDLLNVKPLSAVLREFFGTGQLSQFMDQTNPLSEIAHKRRLSALGPGGVTKDRATFEIRDVHISHYGRICPIETPEGQTIGLISSLSTYATVNDLGFIETAYRSVVNGKIKNDVMFLDAFQESNRYIAQADAVQPGKMKLEKNEFVVRHQGEFQQVATDMIDCIDLSPKQMVSVSTALIPFLEHDDASRALMGSNMQRQAVPLIKTEVALVGTGMEREIGKSSNMAIRARHAGIIEYVSAEKIVVKTDESEFASVDDWIAHGVESYYLKKFRRSNMGTCIHQVPCVSVGDRVAVGDVLTDGSAMQNGELALGTNLVVAFMPWHGYNFEDAIVLNERLVYQDALTSISIDEQVVDARDTKLGPEEITRDIPNVGESALAGLDEDGIIKIGSRVKPGDILVGKVTPKGDVQYSPEEKLLRAIFGEKSREVRDTSLRVPPGVEGIIVDVKVFSRSGIRKDKRYKDEVASQIVKLEKDFVQHTQLLMTMVAQKITAFLIGQKPVDKKAEGLAKDGLFGAKELATLSYAQLVELKSATRSINDDIQHVLDSYQTQLRVLEGLKEERISKFKKGDPLPSGVIKMVKVYVSMKRHISVGDKIAGRHGNKGVISNIVPREDMPYLSDGIAVDVVLNPLGVPGRMNVGQILETNLGFAGKRLGEQLQALIENKGIDFAKEFLVTHCGQSFVDEYVATYGEDALMEYARRVSKTGLGFEVPVFEGPDFQRDIQPLLRSLGMSESGSYDLYDGRTGDRFDQPVTVGSIYMMKLDHMIDDKMHARSVGPYSLVTQQPLGGKAQFGGQRFGEMEVWALEGYGAAYSLQEMLTYKSDDVAGRHKVYESIIRGEDIAVPGLPESFNVLIKELQSLGLQVDLCKIGKEDVSE